MATGIGSQEITFFQAFHELRQEDEKAAVEEEIAKAKAGQ